MLINELSLSKKVLLVEAEKPKPRAIRWRKKKGIERDRNDLDDVRL